MEESASAGRIAMRVLASALGVMALRDPEAIELIARSLEEALANATGADRSELSLSVTLVRGIMGSAPARLH